MFIIELLRRIHAALQQIGRRHCARRALLDLDYRILDDIGLRPARIRRDSIDTRRT